MFEKATSVHQEKLCDRLACAVAKLADVKAADPRVAVKLLLRQGRRCIVVEADPSLSIFEIEAVVEHIVGKVTVDFVEMCRGSRLPLDQCRDSGCTESCIRNDEPAAEKRRERPDTAQRPHTGAFDPLLLDGESDMHGPELASPGECRAIPDLTPLHVPAKAGLRLQAFRHYGRARSSPSGAIMKVGLIIRAAQNTH
ncbi:MAG: hypothetical protein K6C08_10925 [Oscillospiraceae bacterium]|nr:hypothetical protein [Oscillospiraceae bacterium]